MGGGGVASNLAFTAASVPFFVAVPFDQSQLYQVPWLVCGLFVRGEITILAGQGGSAKTALAVHLAVALSAGCKQIGPFTVENPAKRLCVRIISAEEDLRRMALLVAAASQQLSLTLPERAVVDANLRFHDAQASSEAGTPQVSGDSSDSVPRACPFGERHSDSTFVRDPSVNGIHYGAARRS
jgi:hypothetical protein